MRIPSRLDALATVRAQAETLARREGLPESDVQALVLCVHEAVLNAMEHGNRFDPDKQVGIEFRAEPGFLTVEITDEGKGFAHPTSDIRHPTRAMGWR